MTGDPSLLPAAERLEGSQLFGDAGYALRPDLQGAAGLGAGGSLTLPVGWLAPAYTQQLQQLSRTNGFIDRGSNPYMNGPNAGQPPHLPPPLALPADAGALEASSNSHQDEIVPSDKRLSFKPSTPEGKLRCIEMLKVITSIAEVYRADMKKNDVCSKGCARVGLSRLFQDSKGEPALSSKQFGSKWLEFEKMAKDRAIAIGMQAKPADYGAELNTLLATLHHRKELDDRRKADISKRKSDKQDGRSSALQVDSLAVSRVRKRYEDAEAGAELVEDDDQRYDPDGNDAAPGQGGGSSSANGTSYKTPDKTPNGAGRAQP